MRHRLKSMGIVGLALGGLGMVGGTVVGGQIGPMLVGYAVVIGLSALYLLAGVVIRDRAGRRLVRPDSPASGTQRLAGRRVF